MKQMIMLFLLFFSFSLLGQWIDHDSVGASVASVKKASFPVELTGYATGNENSNADGTVYKTNDGARTWTNLNFPSLNSPDIQNIHFIDTLTGFISVRETISGNLTMQVYKTTDGGQNWQGIGPSTASLGYGNSAVYFISNDSGFFSVEDLIYKTYDSGQNWTVDTLSTFYDDISALDFWNGQYGVAGGWDGTFAYTGVLFYTNDGGSTWNEVIIPETYTSIVEVQRVSPTHIYALGDDGYATPAYLFRSTDAGATWDTLNLSQYAISNMDNFTSMYFRDENVGYIGTYEGNILKTVDAGLTWIVDYTFTGTYKRVHAIDFAGNTGYAFGESGKIAKTGNPTALQTVQLSQEITGFPIRLPIITPSIWELKRPKASIFTAWKAD